MTANVESMAWNNSVIGTPWHGLGTEVSGYPTIDEMLVAAGIDWTVSCRKDRVRLRPDGEEYMAGRITELISQGRIITTEIVSSLLSEIETELPGQFHVVRDTDNKHYGSSVTDRFNPIQNRARMEYFARFMEKGGLQLTTMGSLKDGALIFGMARMGEDITVNGVETKQRNLLVYGSHDGSERNTVTTCETDVVCCNTLKRAIEEGNTSHRHKHTKNFDLLADIAKAHEIIGIALRQSEEIRQQAEWLASCKADFHGPLVKEFLVNLTAPKILSDLIPDFKAGKAERLVTDENLNRVALKIQNALTDGPGQELSTRHNTWYGAFQAVTHYVDHVSGTSTKSLDSRASSAMFGQGDSLKQRALDLVQEYALIA